MVGRFPWLVWLAYLLLLAIGIPWYWPSHDRTIWFGMPAWVVVAIAASTLASCLTAWLLLRPWPGEDSEADMEDR